MNLSGECLSPSGMDDTLTSFYWMSGVEMGASTYPVFLIPLQSAIKEVHGHVLVLIQPLNNKRLKPPDKRESNMSGDSGRLGSRRKIPPRHRSPGELWAPTPITAINGVLRDGTAGEKDIRQACCCGSLWLFLD